MTRRTMCLAICIAFVSAGLATGQPPAGAPDKATCLPARPCGCPDTYSPKPLPRIWWLGCGEAACYVPKPLPRISVLDCAEPDNYCRKPLPCLNRPLRQDHYTCEPEGKCHPAIAIPPTNTKTPVQEIPPVRR